MNNKALQIDLIYDIICPWCYVGHQRLRNAILKTNTQVHIHLIPYRIRPELPLKGIPIKEYWQSKGITDPETAYKKVMEAAKNDGLKFNPKGFNTIPNTLKLHQVILKAQENGLGLEVLHAIQSAYFGSGRDLTQLKTIMDITEDFLSIKDVEEAWMNSDYYETLVITKEQKVKEMKINSVPTYIVNGKHRVTGAVANYTLVDMLNQLAPKELLNRDFCDINAENC